MDQASNEGPRARARALGTALRTSDVDALMGVEDALRASSGDVSAAARALGVPCRTLQYWQATIPSVRSVIARVRADVASARADELERASSPGGGDA